MINNLLRSSKFYLLISPVSGHSEVTIKAFDLNKMAKMSPLSGRKKTLAKARLVRHKKADIQEIQNDQSDNNTENSARKKVTDQPVELQESRLRSQNTYGDKNDDLKIPFFMFLPLFTA